MLELYAIPVSLYCAKTRILLRHKGLHWTEIAPPGGYGSAEYKTVVPSGNLPALRDGDLLIGDSEAIAEYLEETHPSVAALPAEPTARALCRERSRFHDTRLEPALRLLFPHLPGRAPAEPDDLDAQSARLTALLEQFAELLAADPSAGDSLTLAECGFPITFAWMDAMSPLMGLNIVWPERVLAYRERIERLSAIAEELSEYRPELIAFLSG